MAISGIHTSDSQVAGLDELVGKMEEKADRKTAVVRNAYEGMKALATGALYKGIAYAPAASRVADLCAAVMALYLR